MRVAALTAAISLALALGMGPRAGQAQSGRDFVFTDEDGHLAIRFAGAGSLDASQRYEVLNAEFSTMVHDRLHADLEFEVEPRDPDWAASMEPQIEERIQHAGLEFSDILVDCRAASCRVIMEQPGHWSVAAHQVVLESVQASIEAFIAERRRQFEPVFMITAYDQENETPHIKAFLRRVEPESLRRPASP